MTAKPNLRGYYWKEGQPVGNLGDTLMPMILAGLGYKLIPHTATGVGALNEGRCLLVIGSLLCESALASFSAPLDIWGCGWKGVALPPSLLAQVRIYAVRGPQTVVGLGLPANTPLGDPALLLPRFCPCPLRRQAHTLVMPHIHRTWLLSAQHRCRLTGCDEMLTTAVLQFQGLGHAGWPRQLRALLKSWLYQGIRLYTPWAAVERLAGASFVLTGSLHGAILAQAYGIPWAAYDDGYVNAPPKWLDWAAYLGIQIDFVRTLAEGQQWWQRVGRHGAIRDLTPLLDAFPYPRTPILDSARCKEITYVAHL